MSDQDSNVVQNAPVADQQQVQQATPPADQFKDLLASIKTEDGRQKYDSPEKALAALPHANEHISKLEKEMAELRTELEKRKTAEELIERLEKQRNDPTPANQQPSVDPDAIASLIDSRLQQQKQAETATNNLKTVIGKLSSTFGDKAEEVFYKKGAEAGLDVATLNRLAQTSPEAVFRIVGVTATNTSAAPARTNSSVNTEALNNGNNKAPTAKLPSGRATTNDLVNAWRAAKPT